MKVIRLLAGINKKYGTTIIIVTHDQQWKEVADQVLYVDDGRVSDHETAS
ncbi:hypothetical protein [Mycoplasma sp. ATU-Cv-508]